MSWVFDYCPEEIEELPEHLVRQGIEACQGCSATGTGDCQAVMMWRDDESIDRREVVTEHR